MIKNMLFALALCGVLAGCGVARGPLATAGAKNTSWREVATDNDRDRLRGWRTAWTEALAAVKKGGASGALAGDPTLFAPDRALADPVPPVGDYQCRWVKLGVKGSAVAEVTDYPAVPCRIAKQGALERFTMLRGDQRPTGLIFTGDPARAVFLGALVLGDEMTPLDYGRDAKRDMAGYVERIGDARWRMVLPRPHFQSMLDLIEIMPAD